ncbi:GNAT family N-acetyltransferase [Corallincola platygyrae]|uniref:GNAT family N-acetyltransferase n=1 Tax=Corallincola platygyrae TaxID=1193278 RepID=A0ABW4XHW7_9GAMM
MKDMIIRAAEPSDAQAVQAIYAQPHAYAGTLQLPYPSQQMWQCRMDKPAEGYHNLVAIVDGKLVGQLGLSTIANPRRKHTANFGMGVCQTVLRQGVGSALLKAALDMCDNWLAVTRVELEVYTDNDAAIALYKKHGFVVEGEHKQSAFRDGGYVDVFSMARVR